MPSLSTRTQHSSQPRNVGHDAIPSQVWFWKDIENLMRGIQADLTENLRNQQVQIDQLEAQMATITNANHCVAPASDVVPSQVSAQNLAARRPSGELEAHTVEPVAMATGVVVENLRFQQTCWDAAAFVGLKPMMLVPESVNVTCLCALSLGIQSCFVLIVFLSLSKSTLDQNTINSLRRWRLFAGHDVRFTDLWTSESLVSRVCRGDLSLHLSDTQAMLVREIDNYLHNNSPFNGPMMCILAMLTWILTASKEFLGLVDMWIALLNIPTGNETVFYSAEGNFLARAFHPSRLLWIACLSLLRLCIAGSLLYAGLAFLSVTHKIEDILLNAVALEFVLNVDELLYRALASPKTRNMILLIKPLALPRRDWCYGMDAHILVTAISVFGLLGTMILYWLAPEIENMREARGHLCGGLTDFSYGITPLRTLVWAVEPSDLNERITRLHSITANRVIQKLITQKNVDSAVADDPELAIYRVSSVASGSGFSVLSASQARVADVSGIMNPSCVDMVAAHGALARSQIFRDALRDASGDQSVASCSEVVTHCSTYGTLGTTVRLACPETCKCNRPGSALAFPFAAEGCPTSCRSSPMYTRHQTARSCTQPFSSLLVQDPLWKELSRTWAHAVSTWRVDLRIVLVRLATEFERKGCEAILDNGGPSSILCDSIMPLRGLRFWCPKYCGCNSTKVSGCPRRCELKRPIPFGTQVPSDI